MADKSEIKPPSMAPPSKEYIEIIKARSHLDAGERKTNETELDRALRKCAEAQKQLEEYKERFTEENGRKPTHAEVKCGEMAQVYRAYRHYAHRIEKMHSQEATKDASAPVEAAKVESVQTELKMVVAAASIETEDVEPSVDPSERAGLADGEEASDGTGLDFESMPKVDFPPNAKYKFNTDPDATMKKLAKGDEELGWRAYTAKEVATWFLVTEGLSTNKIGSCLGSSKEFNMEVMKNFTAVLEFKNLSFDAGMRYYLSLFKLPGEAQQIDRLIQAFADRYIACNPGEFGGSADTAFILAFSVIMLNTDAHNDGIPKDRKMTVDQFVSNNRGIGVNGTDVDKEVLTKLYNNIVTNEIRIEQREYIAMVKLEGWLDKEGGKFKSWKKRWVILSGNVLYYFTTPKDPEPKGWIPLEDVVARPQGARCFQLEASDKAGEIKSAKLAAGKGLSQGHHKQFTFQAETPEERDKWIKAIRDNALVNRFHPETGSATGAPPA